MKIGQKVRVVGDNEFIDSLISETGIIVGKACPNWTGGYDVLVDLDCGIRGLKFDSEQELEAI